MYGALILVGERKNRGSIRQRSKFKFHKNRRGHKSDTIQVGRSSDFHNNFVIGEKSVPRYACRITADKESGTCKIYAGGYNDSNKIIFRKSSVKLSDSFTSNPVLFSNPVIVPSSGDISYWAWYEVSVSGKVYSRCNSSIEWGEVEVSNILHDRTLISIGNVTMMWRTSEGLAQAPTIDALEIELERVMGKYNPNGIFAHLKMGQEPSFYVDCAPATFSFVPCGHTATEKTIKFWANVPIPRGLNGYHAICPFCDTPLDGFPGYKSLLQKQENETTDVDTK